MENEMKKLEVVKNHRQLKSCMKKMKRIRETFGNRFTEQNIKIPLLKIFQTAKGRKHKS